MIVIVDYGVGNLQSVANMFRKAGAKAKISGDPQDIAAADKLLLPGVGHFDYGMKMLRASGLVDSLNAFALEARKPVLGICLGSQILGKGSEEGEAPGLGWIDMECRRLPNGDGIRIPHMGWNEIDMQKDCALFADRQPDARYYFVHSYYMKTADPSDVVATAKHGIDFTCAVQRGNIYGTQFHPEKSLRHGLAVLRAFAKL